MRTNHLLTLAVLCTFPVAGFAQAKKDSAALQKHMDEVVITGQYAPNDPSRAVQKIKVIGRQKIEAMNAQNLKDVLSNELNIRISNDNILGSSVSIGGISGRNVKILIDGVPVVGRQDGNIDLSQINLNNIERIEIVEGPMSVNYGTDALGGVINLITKKELKKTIEGNISLYHETTGTYNLLGKIGYSKKKSTITLNAGRNFFDGWNKGEKIAYDYSSKTADSSRYFTSKPREQYFGTLQYIYKIDNNTTLNYKGDIFKEKITNRNYPNIWNIALDDYYRTSRIDNAVFINSKIHEGNLNVLIAYNDYRRTKNTYLNRLEQLESSIYNSPGSQDTSTFNQFNSRGTYSNNIRKMFLSYELGYDINVQNAEGIRIKTGKQFMGDYAAYGSVEFNPWKRLTIRPGLRYAYNTSYDAPLTPSVNIAYKTTDHLTLRGGYSKGFRAPDLKELYFYFYDINHDIKGNKDLKAEYSDNYNASLVYTNMTGKLLYKVDVSTFYNDILDMISLVPTVGGGSSGREYTYVNIGRFKSKGIQANVDFTINNLKLSVGGSYIGRYNELSDYDNTLADFSYATEMRGSVMYTMPKQGISIGMFYKYTGRLPGFDLDNTVVVPTSVSAYQIADVNASKSFFKNKFQVGAGCKNLFDVSNVRSTTVSGGVHSSSNPTLANGRLYFIKLDYNF